MNRPTFLILGAAKCGTTTLHHLLRQHPDVCMSFPKEPVFFEAEYERGMPYYWSRYFASWAGQRAAGEARGANLFLPYVPARIHRELPDARLVLILREPAARAYSHWWMRWSAGRETLSFEDALDANRRRIEAGDVFDGAEGARRWAGGLEAGRGWVSHRVYLDMGYYAVQMQRYLALFPPAQMRVFLTEDLRDRPHETLASLFEFIGVDPGHGAAAMDSKNEAMGRTGRRLIQRGHRLGLGQLLPTAVKARVMRALGQLGRRPPMHRATRADLVAHYAPGVRELASLIQRPLDHWAVAGARSP